MKRSSYLVAGFLIALAIVILFIAAPFVVYLVYAMTCKGGDCFR